MENYKYLRNFLILLRTSSGMMAREVMFRVFAVADELSSIPSRPAIVEYQLLEKYIGSINLINIR
jgi:hypothetical protein